MTKGIRVTDTDSDYVCGKCFSLMYGDEGACPCCGEINDFTNPAMMEYDEVVAQYEELTLADT
ncbi:hypothetical protein LCGC14_0845550 [marine sediment metagenome]|uniref:Uncharacterized protein n=1 Tax=marine sediment metagenome TaxID=412755 RepID=A0A0F9PGP8_9ZZZZ